MSYLDLPIRSIRLIIGWIHRVFFPPKTREFKNESSVCEKPSIKLNILVVQFSPSRSEFGLWSAYCPNPCYRLFKLGHFEAHQSFPRFIG